GSITDRNGNQLSGNVSGSIVTFTDTLGATALTIDQSNPSTVKYIYTASDGTAATIAVNYSQYTLVTNFGIANVGEYPPTTVSLPASIVFRDSSSYQFTYETTPNMSPYITGRLAS